MILDHKEHRVVLGVDAATLPHVCRLTGCPRGGRVCQAEEGMLPPRGAVSAKGNSSCVKIFRAGETSMAAWFISKCPIFFWGEVFFRML